MGGGTCGGVGGGVENSTVVANNPEETLREGKHTSQTLEGG